MSSTWDLGRDNFYATLTDSGNLNIFPDNHPAEFRVQLNQNILLDPDEWEVSLANIHYVHDFPNIGDSTFIKLRHRGEVFTLELPQWFCKKLEDMTAFLTSMINDFIQNLYKIRNDAVAAATKSAQVTKLPQKRRQTEAMAVAYDGDISEMQNDSSSGPEINSILNWIWQPLQDPNLFTGSHRHHRQKNLNSDERSKGNDALIQEFEWKKTPPRIEFSLDSIDRVKISFTETDFDISFSNDLLEMLGLHSDQDFSVDAFDARTLFLQIIQEESPGFPNAVAFHKTFGDQKLWTHFRKTIFQPNTQIFNFKTAGNLSGAIAGAALVSNPSRLLRKFLSHFPEDYKEFEETGSRLTAISSTWPAKSKAERFIDPVEYRQFIEECEELTSNLDKTERSFVRNGGGFSLSHAIYFAAFILKKLFFGTLSNYPFISRTPGRINPFELLYIYSDLVKPDPFNEMMSRILTSFQTEGEPGRMVTFTPNPRQYKPLDKSNIGNITILIASDRAERVPFQRGPSVLTLHFRRRRFFRG